MSRIKQEQVIFFHESIMGINNGQGAARIAPKYRGEMRKTNTAGLAKDPASLFQRRAPWG